MKQKERKDRKDFKKAEEVRHIYNDNYCYWFWYSIEHVLCDNLVS